MENIDNLILDFLSNRLSRDGFIELKEWTLSSDEHKQYVRQKIELWFSSSVITDTTDYDSEAAFRRFKERIANTIVDDSESEGRAKTVHLWRYIAAAAAVVLFVLLPLAGYLFSQRHIEKEFADITVTVPRGSQMKLTMPDGTEVKLNSGSTLVYSQGFGIRDRRMTLHGEGLFTVKHSDDMPLVINTRELSVEDLGTKFTLANYDDMSVAELTLIEGRIRWTDNIHHRQGQSMQPGEKMTLNKLTKVISTGKVSDNGISEGDFDVLKFTNEPVADIAKTLSRAYNVDISVSPKVRQMRFYGKFNRNEVSVDDILRLFQSVGYVKYKHVGNTYYIY